MIQNKPMEPIYFGKFPSRGDFIKSAGNSKLIQQIDDWLSKSFMDVDDNDARAEKYRQINELHFTLSSNLPDLGTLCGSILPSQDTSGRLFPFLYAGLVRLSNPKAFIQNLPVESETNWVAAYDVAHSVVTAEQDADALLLLKEAELSYGFDSNVNYYEFLRVTSVMRAERLYDHVSEDYSLANSLIGLGLLFQPVVSQGFANLRKFLRFQLPVERTEAIHMATFWIDMLSSFLRNHAVNFLCVMTRQADSWHMLVSFHGLEPKLLSSVIAQAWHDEQWINMNDSAWIADYINTDAGLERLYDVLSDQTQSLFEVRNLFKEIFAGE